MQNNDIIKRAKEMSSLINMSSDIKEGIFIRYSDLYNAAVGDSNKIESAIKENKCLLADNIITWALSERQSKPFITALSMQPNLGNLFSSEEKARAILGNLKKIAGVKGINIPEYCTYEMLVSSLNSYSDTSDEDDSYFQDSDMESEDSDDYFQDEDETGTTDLAYNAAEIERALESREKLGKIKYIDEAALDEVEDGIDITDIEMPDDADEMLTAIINRIEAVFRSCMELDRPYGMLYNKGMLSYSIKDGRLHYKQGADANGESIFERLYTAIIDSAGAKLNSPHDMRCVPNCKNIKESNPKYNYYPGFMFKYALGIVDNKTHRTWKTFKSSLTTSVRGRLKKLVKEKLFFGHQDIIENSFSNSILVLSYEKGSGLKLRISLPGYTINPVLLESNIRKIRTYNNASIAITNMSGFNDVIDVQILMDEDQFLSKPYWAYQAMRVKIDNGDKLSLSDGLPIGRKLNGEVVEFKLDPSSRFLTFIAAGSGAGKGVLTLSIAAAAIGSGIPVFYTDYKPDMAPVFWTLEDKLGINTFTYDAMVSNHKNNIASGYKLGGNMPPEVVNSLGKFASAITYLKSVQLMCAMAKYRADKTNDKDIMFIFDETQAMQRLIKGAIEKTVELRREHKPKTVKGITEEPDAIYTYCSTLLDWFKEINTNIDTYVNTTGRASNTFCIFIAQNPDYSTWNNMVVEADGTKLQMLSRITVADTICKILGRGSTTSKYGLGGDGKKNITPKELSYVANHRFFGMYDGKTTDGAEIDIFKPFLTLNYDDPTEKCWIKGIGKMYGAGSVSKEEYVENVKTSHPGEQPFINNYGSHTGTGFQGLASMYCNGDVSRVASGLQSSWDYAIEFFNITGLINRYSNPTEYIYDLSLDGLLSINNMIKYNPDNDHSKILGMSLSADDMTFTIDNDENQYDINTGWNVENADNLYSSNTDNYDDDIIDFGDSDISLPEQSNVKSSIEMIDRLTPQQQLMLEQKQFTERQAVKILSGTVNEKEEDLFDCINYADPNPDVINNDNVSVYNTGRTGKVIQINPSKNHNPITLNNVNSIDCSVDPDHFIEKNESKFYRGLWGTNYEFSRRWDTILNAVANSINYQLVVSVSLVGQQMYINDKILNMTNIIGGNADVRLENLINLKQLFKRFPNIEKLTLDFDIFQRLQLETSNMPVGLFEYNTKLLYVIIISDTGATKIDRNSAGVNKEAKKLADIADLTSKIRLACAIKAPKNKVNYSVGYKDIIWRTAKSYSNKGFSSAHKQLSKENPNVFAAAWYAAWGVTTAALGGIGYGLGNIIGRFAR